MKRRPRLRPTPWDGVIAALILALAVGCGALFRGGAPEGGTAVASIAGEEVDRFSLADAGEREYTANGYHLHVTVTDGSVRVTEADCPTQDCVHTGAITRSGQSIVCLPGRFILRLEGGSSDNTGVDAVLG